MDTVDTSLELSAADAARLVVTIAGAEALGWENPRASLSAVGFARTVIEAGSFRHIDGGRPVYYTYLTLTEQTALQEVAVAAADWRAVH